LRDTTEELIEIWKSGISNNPIIYSLDGFIFYDLKCTSSLQYLVDKSVKNHKNKSDKF